MWQRWYVPGRSRRWNLSRCLEASLVLGTTAMASPLALAQSTAATSNQESTVSPYLAPAPEIFEATGRASWDGKRTLQGIWVAHPQAVTARRVRIFNTDNDRAVDGALFKRDTGDGGSAVLISSEAAQLLGIEPGSAADLRIVAVTPVERPEPTPQPAAPQPQPAPEVSTAEAPAAPETEPEAPPPAPVTQDAPEEDAPEPVTPETDEPQIALAPPQPADPEPQPAAPAETDAEPAEEASPTTPASEPTFKWEKAPTTSPEQPAADSEPAQPTPAKTQPASKLSKPFVQAGTFGVPSNAKNLIARLGRLGIPAVGRSETVGGRRLTRVLAGPFQTRADRDAAQRKIRGIGLKDARPVPR